MDEKLANELIKISATVLLFDVPEGTEFGIDLQSWKVGPNFKGIKLIPPGCHFLFYSVPNKHGGVRSGRRGFFLHLKAKEVFLRRWDTKTEDLALLEVDEDEQIERIKLGVHHFQFDSQLGPYPIEIYKKWKCHSNCISERIIERLSNYEEKKDPSLVTVDREFAEKYAAGIPEDMKTFDSKFMNEDIPYSTFPERIYSSTYKDQPEKVTEYNFDKSFVLKELIQNQFDGKPDNLLGEFQFSFIMFFVGESYESFEHWKKLVILFCSCEKAVDELPNFFVKFTQCLIKQVVEVPEDFFEDIDTSNNFFLRAVKELLQITSEAVGNKELIEATNKLKKVIHTKFKVNLSKATDDDDDDDDGEEDEYLPTIVTREELLQLNLSSADIDHILNK